MGPIEEIKDLIVQLVEGNEGNKVSIASKIKKQYATYRKDKRIEGKLNEQTTKEFVACLLKNYESIKEYIPINETLEMLIEDYTTLSENSNDLKKQEYTKRIFEIHTNILGNPGTNVDGMTLEYLKIIIENKLDLENGANRDDIINILSQVSKGVEYDKEEYQKFFDDILMPIVDLDIKNSTTDLQNPEIIGILTEIAKNYKRNEEYDKCKEICEKGLKLEQFKETEQYSELKRELDKINEAISLLDTNFEKLVDISEINSAEELIEIIKRYILEGEQENWKSTNNDDKIFTEHEHDPNIVPEQHSKSGKMTLEEKCVALFEFLSELKKEKTDVKFGTPSKGKKGTTWDSYLLLPVTGADFTILECFEEKNNALYMIKNENIEKIDRCRTKREVKNEPGVESANHLTLTPQNYSSNLMDKYRIIMGLEPIKKKTTRFYKKKTEESYQNSGNNFEEKNETNQEQSLEETVAKDTILEDVEEKTEEIDFENLSEEELMTMTEALSEDIEKMDEDNKKLQEEAERLKEDKRRKLIEELKKKRQEMQEKKAKNSELKQEVKRLKEEQRNTPGQTNDSGDTQPDDH